MITISGKFKIIKSENNTSKFEISIISAWEGIDCLHSHHIKLTSIFLIFSIFF